MNLSDLDTKTLNRLYNAHRNIRALCVLWSLGAFILAVGLGLSLSSNSQEKPIDRFFLLFLLLLFLFEIMAIIGLWQRPAWGRIVGIIASCLALANPPFGALIGIFCIYTLAKSPQLFGPDRIKPDELTAEYKKRKAPAKN